MHVFSPFFMTSPLNCPSLFWGILNSAYRPKFGWNLNPKVLEKKLVKNDQCIFTNLILLLSPLSKGRGPSYDQTWRMRWFASLAQSIPVLMSYNEGCFGLLMKNGNGAFSLYFYTISHSKQHGSWIEQPIFPFTPNVLYQNCFIHWPSRFEEEDNK